MTEEYVLQEMKSRGISPIYYHKTDDSRLELDFIIQYKGKLLPIEIKAEGNVRANSLTTLLKANPDLHAVRFSMPHTRSKNSFLYSFVCYITVIVNYCCPVNNYLPLHCFVIHCFIAVFSKWGLLYTMLAEPYY